MTSLAGQLMPRAVGNRHGVLSAVDLLPVTFSDVPGVWHASAPPGRWGPPSPSGGVGWTEAEAVAAATGEALERYAAGACPLPERHHSDLAGQRVLGLEDFCLFAPAQLRDPAFPFAEVWACHAAEAGTFADVWSLRDGRRWWVPRLLVGLGDPAGHGLSTSSGLAAGPTRSRALLRATQELVERDALMVTWDHGLPGRRVGLPERYAEPVAALGGSVLAVDATPAYSPHPVAIVCGWVPMRGHRRIALGAACRATWAEAADKAFLEWCQGVLYAGVVHAADPGRRYRRTADVRTFEDHAAYYTFHPEHWDRVPLLGGEPAPEPDGDGGDLATLMRALDHGGVRLFCRDLTTCDLAQIGVYAVRVLSPDLMPIYCDQAWPYRGGRADDIAWRYPWAAGMPPWANPWPHPLG